MAFTVAIPIYIPWPVHKGCFSSTPWATLVVSCVLKLSHSDRCEVRSHCGNVYTFPFQPFHSIVCLSHLVMETQTGSFLEISQGRRGRGQIENRKLFFKTGSKLWKPCTLESVKHWWKKLKVTERKRKTSDAHRWEEYIFLKCLHYPKPSTDVMQSLSPYQQHLSQS